MKEKLNPNAAQTRAFTIVELAVIVAVLAMLVCLTLPALAKAKTRSSGVGCLSNMRQVIAGWGMYAQENNGTFMANPPASQTRGWCLGQENWGSSDANTNAFYYTNTNALLGAYISSNVRVLTCPGDVIPSDNGRRIRSYSMNGQMGSSQDFNAPEKTYLKESDITCPSPKHAFVFCDESMLSMNDGYLQVSLYEPAYPDLPASYHEGACGFSFADGHAEIHKWQNQFIQVPVIYNLRGAFYVASGTDQDWFWIRDHASCPPN